MEARSRRAALGSAGPRTTPNTGPAAAASRVAKEARSDALDNDSQVLDGTAQVLDNAHAKRPRLTVYEDTDVEQACAQPSSDHVQPHNTHHVWH